GVAEPGDVLEEHVTAGQHGSEGRAQGAGRADDDGAYLVQDLGSQPGDFGDGEYGGLAHCESLRWGCGARGSETGALSRVPEASRASRGSRTRPRAAASGRSRGPPHSARAARAPSACVSVATTSARCGTMSAWSTTVPSRARRTVTSCWTRRSTRGCSRPSRV